MNKSVARAPRPGSWPEIPFTEWQNTCYTLHRWSQIVGKIRLALTPPVNHWWHIPLYVTPRGLTTSVMPCNAQNFSIDLDFLSDRVLIATDRGRQVLIEMRHHSVADMYFELMQNLAALGIKPRIWPVPVEVEERTPLNQDRHSSYHPEHARRFLQALIKADRVFKEFRGRFTGKASPVHFFWGAFDLAVTRFSGRSAPQHPGGPNVGRFVMIEAYSKELSSCGFWPGGGLGEAAFYSYAYPEPEGFKDYPVQPAEAYYHNDLKEFILPYEAVRQSPSPDAVLIQFLQTTYEAAAELGRWSRDRLEVEGAPQQATANVGGPARPKDYEARH